MVSNTSTAKRRFSVTIDAKLVDEIDKLTQNRSQAIEEGLRLWYAKQIEDQLRKFYQNRSQADIAVEQEWLEFVEGQLDEAWSSEGF